MTIPEFFEESVAKFPSNPLMLEKQGDKWITLTYADMQKRVYSFAAGLLSLGLKKGDRVSLLSEGRNDWVVSELAIMYCGAVNVPLSVKLNEPSEIEFRVNHSQSKFIIVSANQLKKVQPIVSKVDTLEKVIVIGAKEEIKENEIAFEDILKAGEEYLQTKSSDFEKLWKGLSQDDYANICYTSGTTADPKGIILTHRNYTANVEQAMSVIDVYEWFTTLLILPWDHSFGHTAGVYTLMKAGASMASVQVGATPMETLKNIPVNIKEIKPHFLLSVPALAKNFKKNIEAGIKAKGPKVEKLFNKAIHLAYKYNGIGWDKGKGGKAFLKPMLKLYDTIIFKKIRANFGGRMIFFVGGGALLDIDLQRFFSAIGMPMYQGYGLSEAAPIISANSPKAYKMGSSGKVVKGLKLKICDDKGKSLPLGEKGEIVVQGENVMKGYWRNEEATAETLKNGWLHTGDMGYLDKDGFLYVLGRFKSLLIGDDGEKFSPEGIEEAFITNSKLIDQCVMYNNQNPYSVILTVVNNEGVKSWAKANGADLSTDEGIEKALLQLETELNKYRTNGEYAEMFPQRWLPAAIGVLPEPFTEENHFMNSTMKLVRGKITEHYQEYIEYLYTPEAKKVTHSKNLEVLKTLLQK